MRMTKKVISEKEEVYDILCNMCGESIGKDTYGNFSDYLSVNKEWGYLSSKDGQGHQFDLCEDCYNNLIDKFKIKCF